MPNDGASLATDVPDLLGDEPAANKGSENKEGAAAGAEPNLLGDDNANTGGEKGGEGEKGGTGDGTGADGEDGAAADAGGTGDKGDEGGDEGGDKSGDKTGDDKGDDKLTGAPEKYEDFTLPDALKDHVDADKMAEFTTVAKDANLTQVQAQSMMDLHTKELGAVIEGVATTILENGNTEFGKLVTGWATTAAADKEYGGQDFKENLSLAKMAIRALAPDLIEPLGMSGMSNHPEMIRLGFKIAQLIGEDTLVAGDDAAGLTEAQGAANMYPSMATKE